jgi:predicted DNA-binding transcriptional regulator AlpA
MEAELLEKDKDKKGKRKDENEDEKDKNELLGKDEAELLDVDETCRFLGGTKPIHPSTLYRGIKTGRYSKPIPIGPQISRWRRSELQRDVERLAAERDPPNAA